MAHKLITKAIEKKLDRHPIGSQDGKGGDAKVLVKFFYPYGSGTWLITEAERLEDGDWRFFGAAEIGHGFEWGYVLMSQLLDIKHPHVPGLGIERDCYGAPMVVRDEWRTAA